MELGKPDHRTRQIDASSALITHRMSFLLLSLVFLLSFLPVQVSCQTLTSTLHSTEYGLKFAYDGEIVSFTCIAEAYSMAWSSDEYIRSDGDRLEFIAIEQIGTEYRAGQTVATLVNISNVNGLMMLESQLQISVQSVFQISSIRCHVGSDTVNTISFGTSGNTSITCDQRSACPGETVTCTCITGYSNTLAWSSDQLIGPNDARLEFVYIDPVNTTLKVPGSNTVAVLTSVSRLNDVVVLFSDLKFVAADNSDNILTCMNVGQQKSYSIIVPMSKNCLEENCLPEMSFSTSSPAVTTDLVASTEIIDDSSNPPRPDQNSNIIIGVRVFFIILIFILLSAIFMLVIKIIKQNKKDVPGSYEDHRATILPVTVKHDGEQGEPATSQDSTHDQEESTTAISVGAKRMEENVEKQCTEDTVKLELYEPISPELQQSESEGGATGWTQFSEDERKKHDSENEIVCDVALMALVAAVDTQKEVFQEVQERNRKKKFIDTRMEDVFENIRNVSPRDMVFTA